MSNISDPWRTDSPGLNNKNTQNGKCALQLANWICWLIQIQISAALCSWWPRFPVTKHSVSVHHLRVVVWIFLSIHSVRSSVKLLFVRAPGNVTHARGPIKSNWVIKKRHKGCCFRKTADIHLTFKAYERQYWLFNSNPLFYTSSINLRQ